MKCRIVYGRGSEERSEMGRGEMETEKEGNNDEKQLGAEKKGLCHKARKEGIRCFGDCGCSREYCTVLYGVVLRTVPHEHAFVGFGGLTSPQ